MKLCVMCKIEFAANELDFLGRCESCFKKYMTMPEDDRPKMDIPYVPIYHGNRS